MKQRTRTPECSVAGCPRPAEYALWGLLINPDAVHDHVIGLDGKFLVRYEGDNWSCKEHLRQPGVPGNTTYLSVYVPVQALLGLPKPPSSVSANDPEWAALPLREQLDLALGPDTDGAAAVRLVGERPAPGGPRA